MSEACSRPSIIWHPDVHDHYSEYLYYYLIRSSGHFPEFKGALLELLDYKAIQGFCLYNVFGDFDVLLRVWLTSQRRDDLARTFQERKYRVTEFVVRDFIHLWHNADSHSSKRRYSHQEIADIGSVSLRAAQNGDAEQQQKLRDRGLLLCSVPERQGFKFFTRLNLATGHYVDEQAINDALIEAIRKAQYVIQPSAYKGMGFAQYLVKAVALDFYDIERFVFELLDAFRIAGGSTITYVMCERDPIECDAIDFPSDAEDEETVLRFVPELRGSSAVALGALRKRIIELAVLENVRAFEIDQSGTLAGFCQDFVNGRLGAASERALSYVALAEYELRELRKVALPVLYGEDAPKANEELMRENNLHEPLTLGALVQYMQALFERASHPISQESRRALKRAVELRNVLAHGSKVDGGEVNVWRSMLDTIAGLIVAIAELAAVVE